MYSTSMPSLFGRPAAVVTGNETLRSIIVELQHLRDSLSYGESDASCEVRRLLSDFSAELHAYFEAEESDEYFGTIGADCPTLKRSLEELRAAHTEFRDTVGALRQLADDKNRGPEVAVCMTKLIVDFGKHERTESAILEDFFRLGDGNGDA